MIAKSTNPAPLTMLDGYGPHVICPECGKQIHFVLTEAGKNAPCELELKQGDGRMHLLDHKGKMHHKAPASVYGWESHHAYCKKCDCQKTVKKNGTYESYL